MSLDNLTNWASCKNRLYKQSLLMWFRRTCRIPSFACIYFMIYPYDFCTDSLPPQGMKHCYLLCNNNGVKHSADGVEYWILTEGTEFTCINVSLHTHAWRWRHCEAYQDWCGWGKSTDGYLQRFMVLGVYFTFICRHIHQGTENVFIPLLLF